VQLATHSEDAFDFFTTKTVGLSRGNPSLGTSVASTCLGLPVVKTFDSHSPPGPITGATGLTTGALCIHTFGDEKDSDGLLSSSIEYFHTPRHHRQASAVAWRPINTNHVAIGLLGSGSAPAPGGSANVRRNPGVRAGGDREFCCFIWDIEAQSSKRTAQPMTKLSHNAAVASLAWLLDGQTLVVGGQSRNIQLYDMRVSGSNAPPISAHAHSMGVHGIQVDPHRPHILATFSRTEGEPVKLWDVRRMDSVVSEIKVALPTNSKAYPETSQPPVVSSIKWSTLESGTLSVAIGDSVQDYDTSSGSRPVLVHVNYAKEGQSIVDLALYEGQKQHRESVQSRSSRLIEVLYPRRMLAVLGDRTVCDMAKHTNSPVAISRRDGRLVHALGRTLWVGSTNEGPCAMESLQMCAGEDISATMMRRARCLYVARYSMNTASNIKMLSEEQPIGESPSLRYKYTLLRLWSWIDRVEALSNDSENLDDMDAIWPANKSLVDAGIWRLLRMDEGDSIDEMKVSEALSCNTYDSQARR
jgi:WD40 repeat protein